MVVVAAVVVVWLPLRVVWRAAALWRLPLWVVAMWGLGMPRPGSCSAGRALCSARLALRRLPLRVVWRVAALRQLPLWVVAARGLGAPRPGLCWEDTFSQTPRLAS